MSDSPDHNVERSNREAKYRLIQCCQNLKTHIRSNATSRQMTTTNMENLIIAIDNALMFTEQTPVQAAQLYNIVLEELETFALNVLHYSYSNDDYDASIDNTTSGGIHNSGNDGSNGGGGGSGGGGGGGGRGDHDHGGPRHHGGNSFLSSIGTMAFNAVVHAVMSEVIGEWIHAHHHNHNNDGDL